MHQNAQKKAKDVTSSLQRQLNSLRYNLDNPRLLPLSANPVQENFSIQTYFFYQFFFLVFKKLIDTFLFLTFKLSILITTIILK